MSELKKVSVTRGSVRQNRICPKVSEWITSMGREIIRAHIDIVDLRDWDLPLDSEPAFPHMMRTCRKVPNLGAPKSQVAMR